MQSQPIHVILRDSKEVYVFCEYLNSHMLQYICWAEQVAGLSPYWKLLQ